MRSTLILGILFASVMLMASVAGARADNAGVKVEKTSFQGWNGAFRISNGIVEAVIVPQIGRIMLFQWVNKPESNPIFLNKALAGKTGADVAATDWGNFGGDKLWPSPQSDWPKHAPTDWPPDKAFDGEPFEVEALPDGVRITGPVSENFAAHAVRTITMKLGEARLYISQEIAKEADAPADKQFFPIGVWNVTQTRGDGTIFLPLPPSTSSSDPGYQVLSNGGTKLPPHWSATNLLLVGRRDPKTSMKIGSEAGTGWVASLYAGDILFSEHYTYQPAETYPDGGLPAEVYTNGGDLAYIEMEILGPLNPLGPAQTEKDEVYWQLSRLPQKPKNDTEACQLVQAAMK